jgi:two-component system cell cycle response regulator
VDPDRSSFDKLSGTLIPDSFILQHASDTEAALHRLKAWKPHVVFAVQEKGNKTPELVQRMRSSSIDDYTAIVLIADDPGSPEVARAFEEGADHVLPRGFGPSDLIATLRVMLRMKELQDSVRRLNHRVEELTTTDELTGALNMRALFRRGEEEILRSRRFRKPVSGLLINLDQFSGINQAYGFLFGSSVIQEAAKRIRQSLRSIDLLARVGGDEFFALLLETDLAGAEFVAEKIRTAIQAEEIKGDRGKCKVTACVGVGGFMPEQADQHMNDMLHIASEALRVAKGNGPGTIEIYSFS